MSDFRLKFRRGIHFLFCFLDPLYVHGRRWLDVREHVRDGVRWYADFDTAASPRSLLVVFFFWARYSKSIYGHIRAPFPNPPCLLVSNPDEAASSEHLARLARNPALSEEGRSAVQINFVLFMSAEMSRACTSCSTSLRRAMDLSIHFLGMR